MGMDTYYRVRHFINVVTVSLKARYLFERRAELKKVISELQIHRGVLQAKVKQQASKIAELENYLNVQNFKKNSLQ
jgi:hypothetical protein